MEQLRLELDLKDRAKSPIPLDPEMKRELLALMARAIVDVHERAQRSGDE